jgi:hypothetical protein
VRRLACICALAAAVVLALAPAVAAASGGSSGGGSKQSAAQTGANAAAAAAEADPSIAAVLDGTGATIAKTTTWGGTEGQPAGYRLEYQWPAAQAKGVNEVFPLLRSRSTLPEAPYKTADYRIRASDVSALQVDVLVDGSQVIQVMPADGETDFSLQEQTWPPFSWFPWFTANPWVLAPVFVGLAALFMVRAWLRSRAWNRRLPSMTRHDRQFIGRVTILLFLLIGILWQLYEGWYALTGPAVGSTDAPANTLTALPLLLIPPGLFVAGLILELSSSQRRGSWALLAVLAGAATAYELAAAMTGAATNLNLTYYILLGVLCILSIPRAFSQGKMGWSRGPTPRYG